MVSRIWKDGILISISERCTNYNILEYLFKLEIERPNKKVESYDLRSVEQRLAKEFADYYFYFTKGSDRHYMLTVNKGENLIGKLIVNSKKIALILERENSYYKFREIENAYINSNNLIEVYKLSMQIQNA